MCVSAEGLWGPGRTLKDLVGSDQLSEITRTWRREDYRRGETLIIQGQPSEWVCVVEEGVFEIVQTRAERSWFQAFRIDGDFLGESAMRTRKSPRTATVVAHTASRVAIGRAAWFQEYLDDSRTELSWLRYLNSRLEELHLVQGLDDPEVRMAGLVRPLVRNELRHGGGQAREVVVRISRHHLAQGLRLGRQRTERLVEGMSIGGFHRKGLLTIDLARWEEYVARLGDWAVVR